MKKLISNHMSKNIITIGWNEKMSTAYHRMTEQKVRHLPVTNEKLEIVGMLSDRDVQRAMISDENHFREPSWDAAQAKFAPEARVRHFMSWPVKSVDKNSDLRWAAELMILEKVSSFIVKDQEKMIGIITSEDMIRILVQILSDPQTPKNWNLQTSYREFDFGPLNVP